MKSRLFSVWKALPAVIVAAFLLAGSFEIRAANPKLNDFNPAATGFEGDERRIFDLINREREKIGLPGLEWNPELARLARGYSRQMADENFFSHYDSRGASVADRAQALRIKNWRKIGENLFYLEGSRNFNALAVKAWMKSPTHRRNILDGDWTTSGIGVAQSRDGRIYITQVFIER